MRYRVIVSWSIYIDRVLSDFYHVGCCSHCLCICDDCSNHPGFLGIETSAVLGDESSLKDCLSGLTKMAWVRGGSNL